MQLQGNQDIPLIDPSWTIVFAMDVSTVAYISTQMIENGSID